MKENVYLWKVHVSEQECEVCIHPRAWECTCE